MLVLTRQIGTSVYLVDRKINIAEKQELEVKVDGIVSDPSPIVNFTLYGDSDAATRFSLELGMVRTLGLFGTMQIDRINYHPNGHCKSVRLGFTAPRHIDIVRQELRERLADKGSTFVRN